MKTYFSNNSQWQGKLKHVERNVKKERTKLYIL